MGTPGGGPSWLLVAAVWCFTFFVLVDDGFKIRLDLSHDDVWDG
jgi:hypothetical protein